jgi:GT2 family glycosyltransferase
MNTTVSGSDVTIVIPNWNGEEHLRECLSSIDRQTVRPATTLLVDNGSTDGSLALVEKEFPWVTSIPFRENRGFAAAVNSGIVASRTAFVALLNNDTRLDSRWLETLLEVLRTHPDLGSAACKMLNFHHPEIVDAAGDALTRGGAPYTRGMGEPDDGRFDRREYVFGACAGAALYRRAVFDDIGLFDEDFVSYYEDQDLAFRAQLHGYRCMYVPAAICYHKRGATAKAIPFYPIRMQERNLTAFYVKNFPWRTFIAESPVIVGSRIRRIFRALRAGIGGPTLMGLAEGMFLIPRMLAKRRRVQKLRTVPLQVITDLLRGRADA